MLAAPGVRVASGNQNPWNEKGVEDRNGKGSPQPRNMLAKSAERRKQRRRRKNQRLAKGALMQEKGIITLIDPQKGE